MTNEALVEAYKGYYEDEYDATQQHADGASSLESAAFDGWIANKIENDSPRDRLHVYLQWNGIIGYTDEIYQIATS